MNRERGRRRRDREEEEEEEEESWGVTDQLPGNNKVRGSPAVSGRCRSERKQEEEHRTGTHPIIISLWSQGAAGWLIVFDSRSVRDADQKYRAGSLL